MKWSTATTKVIAVDHFHGVRWRELTPLVHAVLRIEIGPAHYTTHLDDADALWEGRRSTAIEGDRPQQPRRRFRRRIALCHRF